MVRGHGGLVARVRGGMLVRCHGGIVDDMQGANDSDDCGVW